MFCCHMGFQNILVLPCLADHHYTLACAAREIVVSHIAFVCQRLLHQFTAQSLQFLSFCCILKFEKNIQSDHVFLICLMLLKLLSFSAAKLHNFLPTACSDNTFNLLGNIILIKVSQVSNLLNSRQVDMIRVDK